MSSATALTQSEQATVLVIDDDDGMRRLAGRMLSASYRVLEADGVAAGLALFAREAVDLVLMDVTMPGINGLDGCRALKAAAKGFLPVLLLTGLGGQEDVLAGLEAGADDFLTKPVNRKELQLRVATFVKLRRQELQIAGHVLELRRLVSLKDDMVGVLVHDLRNPLAAVLSIFKVLEETAIDPEMKEDVRVGLSAARRVLERADDLLLVQLLEEGKLVVALETSSPAAVLRAAVETMQPMADDRRVEVSVKGSDDLSLPIDKKLLRRAVENLVGNAVKYTSRSVDVAVMAVEGGAEITVADRGRGIPAAHKSTLFEKYGSVEAREGNARRGVGLGLYMVRLVAAAHQGSVAVEDREGGGSVFRLRISTASGGSLP